MRFRIITFLVVIALVSCVSDKDYNFDSLSVSPTLALPLAYGQVSILDLISDKDSAYLKVYPDGLLYFSYYQTLASQDIRELFKLQDNTSSTSFDVPPGTLPPSPADIVLTTLNKTIDMNLSPEQLSELLLKTGSINYSVSVSPVNPNLSFEINVTLTDVIDKTSLVPMSFTAAQGAASKPLQNYIIKMNNNKFNVKLQMVLKKKNTSTFIAPNTKANITLSFTGLDFTYMKGFLGDQSVALPTQSIDLTAFSSPTSSGPVAQMIF